MLVKNVIDGGPGQPSEVNTAPLAKWSSWYSIHTLVAVRVDRLVLRATNFVRGLSITFFVSAAVILLGWAETNTLDENKARGGRVMMGGLFLILGCGTWLAPQRVVFDRRRGQMSRRYWFFRFCYPLKDIVALQVIYGGWHNPSESAEYETRELNLVLNNSYAPRVNLTNHADHPTTRSMAAEIARFLDVPVWDAFERELRDDAIVKQQAHARSPVPKLAAIFRWLAGFCYLAAFVAATYCVVLSLQQAKLDELEATIQPVRARLIATEVKEWIEGNDDWSAFGTFEIESGEYQGRATGDLIPQRFYRDRDFRPADNYSSIPRAEAAKFLALWEIGEEYDGYIHSDARDGIFFELPGAEVNALKVRQLRNTSGIFLTLGLVASGCVAYTTRRRKEGGIDKTLSTVPGDKRKRRRGK